MSTKTKIRINDNKVLRKQLDEMYCVKSQVEMAEWSLKLAKHILELVGYDYENCDVIQKGFAISERRQKEDAMMHEVRQAGFEIHRIAKESPDEIEKTALRVAGQAVAAAHMKEHAMVASDYAIKVVNLMYPNNMDEVTKERQWQISSLDGSL